MSARLCLWAMLVFACAVAAHFGLRTERFKLVFFYGTDYVRVPTDRTELGWGMANNPNGNRYHTNTPPAWELYDLQEDPKEMRNEYGNPEYAAIVARLKAELLAMRTRLGETDDQYPHIQKIVEAHWND